MSFELDHLFVLVSPGAPEAERLTALGLTEGPPNRHPGQGTECRRFFFANAYLELLWVNDPEEALGEVVRPLHLWERWSGRGQGACPFGISLRPRWPGTPDAPFPAWEYRPPYPLVLRIGANSDRVEEPLLSCLSRPREPGFRTPDRQRPEHRAGWLELTALRAFLPPSAARSPVLQAAEQTGAVAFHEGPGFLAEVGLDGERQGQRADLRPALPLVLCW